jgi:hypothetical protein
MPLMWNDDFRKAGLKPNPVIVLMMIEAFISSGAYSIMAFSEAKFTAAFCTPGSFKIAFSILAAQLAQDMPLILTAILTGFLPVDSDISNLLLQLLNVFPDLFKLIARNITAVNIRCAAASDRFPCPYQLGDCPDNKYDKSYPEDNHDYPV